MLGWNVAEIPFGSDVAVREKFPETVPIATNFSGTLSFTSGATIRGCLLLIVRVPEEEPELDEELLEEEVTEAVVAVNPEETIGIET